MRKTKFRSSKRAASVTVELTTRHRNKRIPGRKVKSVVVKCASSLLPYKSTISVALLDDMEMTEINEAYTGREGSTDVLSFPLGVSGGDNRWHGEILISLDRACRQARQKGVLLIQEVTRLLVHAFVHLAGLDHHDVKRFKEMRKAEFYLLLKCL